MPKNSRPPAYRLHKARNLAVVTIDGRNHYLGLFGSDESHEKYARILAEWRSGPIAAPATTKAATELSIVQLIRAYWRHAKDYYRKGGKLTSEATCIREALRPLKKLYGRSRAADFGPKALCAVRLDMIDRGWVRGTINRHIGRIKRMFRWAVEQELVPPSLHHALTAVGGLRAGRSEAKESAPVRPVPTEHVEPIKPFLARQVAAMIELQLLTGMRPGEVVQMRTADIDRSFEPWVYTPVSHKTEHTGRSRPIVLGPRAQALLTGWLRESPTEYLFQPREARAEQFVEMRRRRKTPVQPSQLDRRKKAPKSQPGTKYSVASYRHAIERACDRVTATRQEEYLKEHGLDALPDDYPRADRDLPRWSPHRLRHNAATEIRRRFSLEAAKAVLGHSDIKTTQIYAEADLRLAAAVMKEVG